jgi:protein-disulfide isomerase
MKTRQISAMLSVIFLVMFATAGLAFAENPAKVTKVMGTPVSAITIEVYSDFQCPKCKFLHENWMGPLIRDYVRTGRAYLIQHEFPLTQHAYAKTAACYACAADRVGKYGEVCDALFKKQEEWEKDGKVDQTACSVLTPSEAAKVRTLAKDPEILAQVQKDMDLGMKVPLRSTPTVIVTYKGKKYPVDVQGSYSIFTRFLDSLH